MQGYIRKYLIYLSFCVAITHNFGKHSYTEYIKKELNCYTGYLDQGIASIKTMAFTGPTENMLANATNK